MAPQSWRPEDVYAECLYGDAAFIASCDGFVVVSVQTDKFTNERTLYIWIAYAYNRGFRFVEEHDMYFQLLAKQLGCRYIETATPITGVYDYLCETGWKPKTHVLVRDLDEQPTEQQGL